MKYFLIHGYGKSLDIREKIIPKNLGFYIFDNELNNKDAYVFNWSIGNHRSFISKINIISQLKLYYKEKSKIEKSIYQKKLFEKINELKPEIMICHSMGCKFFLDTIKKYGLNKSIKQVIFVLADIPQNTDLTILSKGDLKFKNIYCWWDNALLSSMLLNRYKPIGLFGIPYHRKFNIFWRLNYGINLHQDIWRDNNFKIKLKKIITNV